VIGFPSLTVGIFIASVAVLFTADVISHKRGKVVTLKSSVVWSFVYIASALAFSVFISHEHGAKAARLFLTGYTLEKVLAFDNLFVFSLIFAYFKIPQESRHAALHWGIVGAVVFRLIFTFFGVGSIHLFGGAMDVVFAGIILFTVYLMASSDDGDYQEPWYVGAIQKRFPSISTFVIAIIVIEVSDVLFAFDSVPAIIAVTKDPLLIYSSMIFAILGLRSMYFVIDAMSSLLKYMDQAIMCVLVFIAGKLLVGAAFDLHLDEIISLFIILFTLLAGVIFSLGGRDEKEAT
jgi:tellurite resistance protein TerC